MPDAMFRLATSIVSPAGGRARLSAFIFHQVLEKPDPLRPGEPDARRFDQLLGWIRSQFRVLQPLQACEQLFAGSLPSRAAVITFDDGYRNNYDVALPLLKRHGVDAVVFVATAFLGDGVMFNDRVIEAIRGAPGPELDLAFLGLGRLGLSSVDDRRSAIRAVLEAVKALPLESRLEAVERLSAVCGVRPPRDLMMTPEQVRGLADAGVEVGGHTRNHPILRVLDPEEARAEIAGCHADLSGILGTPPALFAYPNGRPGLDFTAEHTRMVASSGFRFAFSTDRSVADRHVDPFAIPRFTPWDRTRVRFQARMLAHLAGGSK